MGYDPETIQEWTQQLQDLYRPAIRFLIIGVVLLLVLIALCTILGIFGILPPDTVSYCNTYAGLFLFLAIIALVWIAISLKLNPVVLKWSEIGNYYDRSKGRLVNFPYASYLVKAGIGLLILLFIDWTILKIVKP